MREETDRVLNTPAAGIPEIAAGMSEIGPGIPEIARGIPEIPSGIPEIKARFKRGALTAKKDGLPEFRILATEDNLDDYDVSLSMAEERERSMILNLES